MVAKTKEEVVSGFEGLLKKSTDGDGDFHERTRREARGKVLAFLAAELVRKEGQQCVHIILRYAPGNGFRDEELRRWLRDKDFSSGLQGIEQIVSTILEIAEGEVEARGEPGKYRFVVRTEQHLGDRATHTFSLHGSSKSFSERGDKHHVVDYSRKHLLARMAANVAAGIVAAPSKATVSAKDVAKIALDVAEEILAQVGL